MNMTWQMLVSLVVVPAVLYILGNLFGGKEEEQAPRRQPRLPPSRQETRQRVPPTDIERFLEAINRRRQETAPPAQRPQDRPTPVAGRPRQPPRPMGQRPAPGKPTVEVLVVEEVARTPNEPLPDSVLPAQGPVPITNPSPVVAAPLAPALSTGLPLLGQIRPFVTSRASLQKAFLLQEIFGTPRSRRPRPIPGRHV